MPHRHPGRAPAATATLACEHTETGLGEQRSPRRHRALRIASLARQCRRGRRHVPPGRAIGVAGRCSAQIQKHLRPHPPAQHRVALDEHPQLRIGQPRGPSIPHRRGRRRGSNSLDVRAATLAKTSEIQPPGRRPQGGIERQAGNLEGTSRVAILYTASPQSALRARVWGTVESSYQDVSFGIVRKQSGTRAPTRIPFDRPSA
jgi:hypothetical protein